MSTKFDGLITHVREIYSSSGVIPLHEPILGNRETSCLITAVSQNTVGSTGICTRRLERQIENYVGIKHAVCVVNGTSALHLALKVIGVGEGDEIITQSLNFVAGCNAISYCGAHPVFVDVSRLTMGMDPECLSEYLRKNTVRNKDGSLINERTGREVKACMPMHTFGHPVEIKSIKTICDSYGIQLVEDAAEALGTQYLGHHVGTTGSVAIFSFNGNKIVTAGGGGVVVTNDLNLSNRVRRLSTTARVEDELRVAHDEVGFNYRMPDLNAALASAQMESLPMFLRAKREVAKSYKAKCDLLGIDSFEEPTSATSNFWLNVVVMKDAQEKDRLIREAVARGVLVRPAWELMHKSIVYKDSARGSLSVSEWLADRIVTLPSSVPLSYREE